MVPGNEINCDIVPYEYTKDLHAALNGRKVDAIMDVRVIGDGTGLHRWKSVHRFPAEPLYFAINKERPDLLKELNEAQSHIIAADEYYAYSIMEKYHDGVNSPNVYLSPMERQFIEERGVLRLGYLQDANPLSYRDTTTGSMRGLGREYMDILTRTYGMQFVTHAYQEEKQMVDDLLAGKVDIILPVGLGYWMAEEYGMALSTSIAELPMSALYIDNGNSDIFRCIAVVEDFITYRGYIEQNYPQSEVLFVESTEAALAAVGSGRATCCFMRSNSLDRMHREYGIYDTFHTIGLEKNMENCMAIRMGETTLSILLDSGLSLLTESQKEAAKIRYNYPMPEVTLWTILREYWGAALAGFLLVILFFYILHNLYRLRIHASHMTVLQEEKGKAEVARERAEQAQLAKTEFLFQMSHDIRTPMNAILGFANLASSSDDLEAVKTEYLPKIDTAGRQLLMLINDVLEMSRIESGKLTFNRQPHDIAALVGEVVSVVGQQAEEKGLHLTADIRVQDRNVRCDENHLNRVLVNLLSNAIKFTERGGRVEVSLTQQPEAEPGFAAYDIRVADTGIGMSSDFVSRIFQPFEQERTSTVSRQQGTGLGMAIVKRIVDAAGFTIEIETALGEGTAFTIHTRFRTESAPVGPSVDSRKLSLDELKDRLQGYRLLLVEDNEFNAAIAQAILEQAGFLVETAGNGQQAVDLVAAAPEAGYYDAILMDIQMPVMNGYEASRVIRGMSDERRRVPILAVTANAFDSDRENAFAAGMDGHIAKPLDISELYHTLVELLEEK